MTNSETAIIFGHAQNSPLCNKSGQHGMRDVHEGALSLKHALNRDLTMNEVYMDMMLKVLGRINKDSVDAATRESLYVSDYPTVILSNQHCSDAISMTAQKKTPSGNDFDKAVSEYFQKYKENKKPSFAE